MQLKKCKPTERIVIKGEKETKMKTRKTIFGIMALFAIITIGFIACGNGDKETHTHTWGAWEETKAPTVTADGEETRTCATCGEKETRSIQKLPEQPQFRETTITLTFGENTYTAKVQGTLLQEQWTGTADKIKGLLEDGYAFADEYGVGGRFDIVFSDAVTIIVEKTTEYEKYKVLYKQFRTLYLNVDALDDDWDDLMVAAVGKMRYETPSIDGNPYQGVGYETKPLTFGTAENPCSVTVISEETFTTAEWNTLVDKVVAAIMRGYNKDMGDDFENAFKNSNFKGVFSLANNAQIILSSSATYNCEVKSGEDTKLYLKTSAIDTVDIQPAITAMAETETYTAN
jgi:hypothetical protein